MYTVEKMRKQKPARNNRKAVSTVVRLVQPKGLSRICPLFRSVRLRGQVGYGRRTIISMPHEGGWSGLDLAEPIDWEPSCSEILF